MRLLSALMLLMLACAPARAEPVVFAAASLSGVLEAVYAGEEVTLVYGGSGALARQVAAGAPADAIVLAHPDWMDWLEGRGALKAGAREDVARGRLVLIARADSPVAVEEPDTLAALLSQGRLAIGQRDAVPAGRYAVQWLQHIGAWEAVLPQLAETENVRAALSLVALAAVPHGIVYATDAAADPRVRVLYEIPPDSHDPIRYEAAALTPEGAIAIAVLTSEAGQAVLARHGFGPP